MGHSQARKAESRERILDTAAKQIRDGGFDSLSIAELMKAAQLTHGGFYGHFPSRAALIAAALDRALDQGAAELQARLAKKPGRSMKSIVNAYLNGAHRDSISGGCAIAALAADVARSRDAEVRDLMAQRLERAFKATSQAMGGGPAADEAALAAWSTMVGSIILARVFRDDSRGDEILEQGRRAVLALEDQVRKGAEAPS